MSKLSILRSSLSAPFFPRGAGSTATSGWAPTARASSGPSAAPGPLPLGKMFVGYAGAEAQDEDLRGPPVGLLRRQAGSRRTPSMPARLPHRPPVLLSRRRYGYKSQKNLLRPLLRHRDRVARTLPPRLKSGPVGMVDFGLTQRLASTSSVGPAAGATISLRCGKRPARCGLGRHRDASWEFTARHRPLPASRRHSLKHRLGLRAGTSSR